MLKLIFSNLHSQFSIACMVPQTQRLALIGTVIVAILLVVIAVLARNLMATQATLSATLSAAMQATAPPTALVLASPTLPLETPQPIIITATPLPATETPLPTNTPTNTPTPTPLPVPSWSETSKLTTLEYLNTVVIERKRTKEGIESVIPGEDRIVMEVVGKIHVGIDLEKLPVSKIEINGKRIKLVIPHAKILSVELLPQESHIYEAGRTWVYSTYEGLEKEAFEEALMRLQENSPNNAKMLQMAETLARLQLTQLLRNLGYEEVIIEFE